MVPSDDIFHLIKSLSKEEKRHFILFSKRYQFENSKLYIQIFQEIDKMEYYDERLLKRNIKYRNQVGMLATMKHYLQKMILRSLRDFYTDEYEDISLMHWMVDEFILSLKGITRAQYKVLKKMNQHVEKIDLSPLKLASTYKYPLLKTSLESPDGNYFKRAMNEELKIIDELKQQIIIKYIFLTLWQAYKDRTLKKMSIDLTRVMRTLNRYKENDLTGGISKWYYYRSYTLVYTLINKRYEAHMYYRKIFELYESGKLKKENPFPSYQSSIINYLASSHRLGIYDEFEHALSKVSVLKVSSINHKSQIFSDTYFYQLLYLINTAQFDRAIKSVEEIEDGIRTYKKFLPNSRLRSFYFNIAILYFFNDMPSSAIDYINLITKAKMQKNEIYFAVLFLEILIHMELNNYKVVKYKIRNLLNKIPEKSHLLEYAKASSRMILKFLSLENESEQIGYLKLFRNDLIRYRKRKISLPFIYELEIWVLSKLLNQSLLMTSKMQLTKQNG